MSWSRQSRHQGIFCNPAIIATLALHLILSGCQPIPQPFAHSPQSNNPIVVPTTDFAGVTILPIPGLPPPLARRLSVAMAEELHTHEIIASPDSSNQRSKFLQGAVTEVAAGRSRTRVTVIWDLFDGRGKFLGSRKTTRILSNNSWPDGGKKQLRPLVRAAAADVARLVKGGDDAKSPVALHVWRVVGVPDKKSAFLRRAMKLALKRRDFLISEQLEGAGLVVAGRVELGAKEAEPRPIRITWSVRDRGGNEVGTLTQRNAISRLQLEKGWNSLAAMIADNAAGGVGDLVVRLPRNVLESKEKPAN